MPLDDDKIDTLAVVLGLWIASCVFVGGIIALAYICL